MMNTSVLRAYLTYFEGIPQASSEEVAMEWKQVLLIVIDS